jgi:hypothetical protein
MGAGQLKTTLSAVSVAISGFDGPARTVTFTASPLGRRVWLKSRVRDTAWTVPAPTVKSNRRQIYSLT